MIVNNEGLLPPGFYFVGDPCYAVRDRDWDSYLEQAEFDKKTDGATVVRLSDDRLVCSVNTAFGDGVYEDQRGMPYPVDAGLIGVVSAKGLCPLGMHEYKFDHPFGVYYENGKIYIDALVIDTDPEINEYEGVCKFCEQDIYSNDIGLYVDEWGDEAYCTISDDGEHEVEQ